MANTVNQVTVLTALNNLMGRRVLPGGNQDDLKRYCQYAFDYAWRYYKWGFSLANASVVDDGSGNFYLPDDFDIDGYRFIQGGVTEVTIEEIASSNASNQVAIVYDAAAGKYKTSPGVALTLTYQVTPPTLVDNVDVPFPSAMTIAIGASIYAKQAENPTRADISQEWDEFHSELDRHVSRSFNNTPRRQIRNYHDKMGSYTGYTGA